MTVCVAAICEDRYVVGASDRLLTTGDIQFAPPQTKVFQLTDSVAAMIAGDTVLCHELLMVVWNTIRDKPSEAVTVRECAEAFLEGYQQAFLRQASRTILAPLGLDHDGFLARQKEMEPNLVNQIAGELWRFEISPEGAQAIFAGVDAAGPHLYKVDRSCLDCYDSVGFAAIGTGDRHAQSQLMFAQHMSKMPLARTLLQVYWAKKRAEVAPGVGEQTDMFVVGPGMGSFSQLNDRVLLKVHTIYAGAHKRELRGRREAEAAIQGFVEELFATAVTAHQEAAKKESGGGGGG